MTMHAPALSMLEDAARHLLPPGVAVAATSVAGKTDPLWPVEESAMALSVPRRRQEFAAGRTAARLAMQSLGHAPAAIAKGADRAPVWPRDLVGSISHDDQACIAVVAERDRYLALGVDLEPYEPLDTALLREICRPEEQSRLRDLPEEERGLMARRIFSAKECLYKCQYALTRAVFGFEVLSLDIDADGHVAGRFTRTVGPIQRGTVLRARSAVIGGWILSLAVLEERPDHGNFRNSVTG